MDGRKNNTLRNYYIFLGILLVIVLLYDQFGKSVTLDEIRDETQQAVERVFHEQQRDDLEVQRQNQREAEFENARQERAVPGDAFPVTAYASAGTEIDFYTIQRFGPVAAGTEPAAQQAFMQHYQEKFANPAYEILKNTRGLPDTFQDFPEEALIKQARSLVAASMQTPASVTPAVIPVLAGNLPVVDGRVDPAEWQQAVTIRPAAPSLSTQIFLVADSNRLYVACIAPEETTVGGYDQFRFYFHLNTIPALANERIHIDGGGKVTTIRQTEIRWNGSAPAGNDERWKNYPVSDWVIFRLQEGASNIYGFRHYELSLDLEEAGLHIGVPFPAKFEIETDPSRDGDGKFQARNYLGNLGSDTQPFWFVIGQ